MKRVNGQDVDEVVFDREKMVQGLRLLFPGTPNGHGVLSVTFDSNSFGTRDYTVRVSSVDVLMTDEQDDGVAQLVSDLTQDYDRLEEDEFRTVTF
jgi:hypothetical protein